MKVGACSCPQGDRRRSSSRAVCVGSNGETALVRVRACFKTTTEGTRLNGSRGRPRRSPPRCCCGGASPDFRSLEVGEVPLGFAPALGGDAEGDIAAATRSEERRVGKECR